MQTQVQHVNIRGNMVTSRNVIQSSHVKYASRIKSSLNSIFVKHNKKRLRKLTCDIFTDQLLLILKSFDTRPTNNEVYSASFHVCFRTANTRQRLVGVLCDLETSSIVGDRNWIRSFSCTLQKALHTKWIWMQKAAPAGPLAIDRNLSLKDSTST